MSIYPLQKSEWTKLETTSSARISTNFDGEPTNKNSAMAIDNRLVFYTRKHVKLKVLTKQDVDESNWVGWFNDEGMTKYNTHHFYPNTFDAQYKILEGCVSKEKFNLEL